MLSMDQIANPVFGNILSTLILLVLIGFLIIYRNTVKAGVSLFGSSLFFILQYPTILIFAIIRLLLFALLDIAILAWFFPEMGWRAFITHPIQKLLGLFEQMCLPGIPYGVIILFLFFAIGLLMSVATTHYTLARLQQQLEPSPYSINVAMYNMPQILIWSLLYAIVYFGIITKQLFLLPFMVLLTFFVTAVIAQGSTNLTNSLIRSVQIMRVVFGKTVIFILVFGLLEMLLGVISLQKNLVIPIIVYFLLTTLTTIKDVFKALVIHKIDINYNRP